MNKYITELEKKSLKRNIYELPEYISRALLDNSLVEVYKNRPAYQKNDYIGWITRAKREVTKKKRLNQMISELKTNDRYMGMDY